MIRKKRIFPLFLLAFALILQGCSSNEGNDGKSSDASLASLEITGYNLNPVFNSETTAYTATVYVEYVTVKATAAHENATVAMTLDGAAASADFMEVQNGSNTINVIVTAEKGNTETYSIAVTKIDISTISSKLADLSCTLNTEYPYSEVYALYSIDDQQWDEQLSINARVSQFNATVAVDTIDVSVDDEYNPFEKILSPGNNTTAIKVTSDDGTEKTYTITVNRTSPASTATGLSFSSFLTPDPVEPDTFNYTGTEDYFSLYVMNPDTGMSSSGSGPGSSNISLISARREAFRQTITVSLNNAIVDPFAPDEWQDVALLPGSNEVHVDVTAEDGIATRRYTLNITNN